MAEDRGWKPGRAETRSGSKMRQALAEALRRKQSEQWLAENCEAVHTYNEYVEAQGVFSDSVRSF
ncbi:type II toxin-antitoxin system CcdA family antitoxin [Pseudomonas sp. FW215-L1]|uniref:type II toxin-antitoxin system CcdA family antitoxin n=1 Tax=unclassified Pseudomonas TaxID=196821 RepID=UPI0026BF3142|nr:type II toxin-antitoxin system CcdA family antitoxin [Pseudomonas sp. FW215-L1]